MIAGSICRERDRLLKAVTHLTHAYAEAAMLLECSTRCNNHALFLCRLSRAEEMRNALRAARDEYNSHVDQHGCKWRIAPASNNLAHQKGS